MNDLRIETDRTPLLWRQPERGAQSIPEVEERTQTTFQRVISAIVWFFSMLNPFSCCKPSSQADEGSDQANLMERGELAQRVSLPAARDVLEVPQVLEKQYETIDLGGGHSLKLEIPSRVPISSSVGVQREERVVAKPVAIPRERPEITRRRSQVKKLESRLVQIDRELASPKLKKTSNFQIYQMLGSDRDAVWSMVETNGQIDRLNQERPAVERELMNVRSALEETVSFYSQWAS